MDWKTYYSLDPEFKKILNNEPQIKKQFNLFIKTGRNGEILEKLLLEYWDKIAKIDYNGSEKIRNLIHEFINHLDNEYVPNREIGYSRFSRLAHKLKLDIATHEEKINFIKQTNFNKFLDIFSVSNGLLRNVLVFQRWKNINIHKEVSRVGSGGAGVNLYPPKNSRYLFKDIYLEMQKNINITNSNYWATIIYFAFVVAHMFPDGNGRISRHAYYFIRDNKGILNEETTVIRSEKITKICENTSWKAVVLICNRHNNKEGRSANIQLKYGAYDNDESISGYFNYIYYIALRDTLEVYDSSLWLSGMNNANHLGIESMPKKINDHYEKRLENLKIEFFHDFMSVVKNEWESASKELDKILKIN